MLPGKPEREPQAGWGLDFPVIRTVQAVPEREIRSKVGVGSVMTMMPHMFMGRDQHDRQEAIRPGARGWTERGMAPQVQTCRERRGSHEGTWLCKEKEPQSIDPHISDQQWGTEGLALRDEDIEDFRSVMHSVERPPSRRMEQPMVPIVEIIHGDKVETEGHEPGDGQHTLKTGSHSLAHTINKTRSESRSHKALHDKSGTVYYPCMDRSSARCSTPPACP